MRDQQQCRATLGLFGKQKIGNLASGLGVEIAGGLVGNQHGGGGGKRPGNRHALLFTAGQLAGIMRHAFAKANGLKLRTRNVEGVFHIRQFQRHGNVFERGHVGDEVKGLEDDADVLAAKIGKRVFAERMKGRVTNGDFAAVEPFEPGQNHQKGRFAGAGRADDADRLAAPDIKIDPLQHMHGGGRTSKGQIRLLQCDDGFSHGKAPYIGGKSMLQIRLPQCGGPAQSRDGPMKFKAALLHVIVIAGLTLAGSAQAKTLQLVGFGDSLMAGYQLPSSESYTAQLEKALKAKGHDVAIANAGVSGDTTAAGLSRVDWSVPDGTDGVILELGANDALRGIAPAETENNLDAIITRLKARNIPVLLAGMIAPPNMGGAYGERYNGIYERLSQKHGIALYPFFLDGVVGQQGLQLEDGMHPNAKGVQVMVDRSLPAVEAFLAGIKPTQ
jgi:acyl-CoA thioesterase I